jgi:hypothetical protein
MGGTGALPPQSNKEYLYPPVRLDLMRQAIDAFFGVLRQSSRPDAKLFRKAASKVEKVVQDDWTKQQSYVGRCHAFRNLINAVGLEGFGKWATLADDGKGFLLHEAVYHAVAITPMSGRGTRFLKTEFMSAVEKIAHAENNPV